MSIFQRKNYIFTSESVSEGHPDKICDQISDLILDYLLSINPKEKVAVEAFANRDTIYIGGEISRKISKLEEDNIEEKIRLLLKDIGYNQELFHWNKIAIKQNYNLQSTDISRGITEKRDAEAEGAGDQGIMFGYACNETESLMPAAIFYANRLLENIFKDLKAENNINLGPDAKTQITLEYKEGLPYKVKKIVLSIQHKHNIDNFYIKERIYPYLPALLGDMFDSNCELFINPTGKFIIGGPEGDVGLTGRKIIIDTYGGHAPHGGGAFSGKDPTKVDRSAAYMARYLAKNLVASGLANYCLIQISYAIGLPDPMSFYIATDNSNIDHSKLELFMQELIDLRAGMIRRYLQLNNPIYLPTSTYGHFGRENKDMFFTWEKIDLVDIIQKEKNYFIK